MSPSFRILFRRQSPFVLCSLLRGKPIGRCDTACSIPVLCIAYIYLPGKLMETFQICRRKLLLLLVTYIPVVSLSDHRNPLCCVSAKVRIDEWKSILYEEVFLSVAYLLISPSGNCQIELLELCVICLGLGDFFFFSLVREIKKTLLLFNMVELKVIWE